MICNPQQSEKLLYISTCTVEFTQYALSARFNRTVRIIAPTIFLKLFFDFLVCFKIKLYLWGNK